MTLEKENSVSQVILMSTSNHIQGLIQNRFALINAILLVPLAMSEHLWGFSAMNIWFLISTNFGQTTNKVYRKTLIHLRKHKKMDPRFFKATIRWYWDRLVFGYCELQWMYLAAKKCGYEEDFFDLKKKYTDNIVPNF